MGVWIRIIMRGVAPARRKKNPFFKFSKYSGSRAPHQTGVMLFTFLLSFRPLGEICSSAPRKTSRKARNDKWNALGAAEFLSRLDPFGEDCLSPSTRLRIDSASFRAILIRDGGGGTRRAAHRQKWFWALLPKQKCLVARGRNPAI